MLLRWSQRTRDGQALVLAGALHGAVLVGLWGWAIHHARVQPPVLPAALVSSPQRPADQVEVEIDWPTPSGAALSIGSDHVSTAPPPSPRVPGVTPERGGPVAQLAPPLANDVEQIEPAASTESAQTPPDASPPGRGVDLGLGPGDWRRWLSQTKSDRPAAERAHDSRRALFRAPPVSSSGGLQEGLEAHDRAIGMGTSGPVVSALYHAAHADEAPFEGVARFQITVLKTGAVEVILSDASSDLGGWRAVAANAAEALRRTPPRIPNPRQGARLVVEINAKQTYPNGVQPKQLHGLRAEVEPLRFRSVQSAQRELIDRNPVAAQRAEPGQSASGSKANVNLPGVYVGARGKVCGYRLGLTLLSPLPVFEGGCDLSNLGAKPQRLVSTLVREETLY